MVSEKAYSLAIEAWKKIVAGDYYNDGNNTNFEYMLKSLQRTEYGRKLNELIKHSLPSLQGDILNADPPLPFVYIIISINNEEINKKLADIFINHFIKEGASQNSTYQLINFLNTMSDKGIDIMHLVKKILNNLSKDMNPDMINAFAVMTINNQPTTLAPFVDKFADFAEKDYDIFLKDLIRMTGKKGLVELLRTNKTKAINKILKGNK